MRDSVAQLVEHYTFNVRVLGSNPSGITPKMATLVSPPIVFFDGVCGLCNKFVNFLMRKDKKGKLRFATLQGKTADQLIAIKGKVNMDTIILYDNGKIYYRSTAALKLFTTLGGTWKLMAMFFIVPPFLRNFVYDIIARNRYKWYGKRAVCRVPMKEEQQKFLD